MALPELIEIEPLQSPVQAEITVPGSKSITNRALILAALADGEVTLQGALWSEDTQVMVDCLQKLGFEILVEPDPNEFCNRTIKVRGLDGKIPKAGTTEKPLELFVGNAGTAARFLSAFVCLGDGVYRLSGVPRMHERPQAALFNALRELGYRVEAENKNDKLPVLIFGSSRGNEAQTSNSTMGNSQSEINQSPLASAAMKRSCTVSIEESSQFASALLLSATIGDWNVKITGENAEESPYVAMTSELIKVFPKSGGTFQIEPDASSGSYFWDTQALLGWTFGNSMASKVRHWPRSNWQVDARHHDFLKDIISRKKDMGDRIMGAIAIAPLEPRTIPKRFTDLGRLRVQECERVAALRTELTKCGAKVIEEGDTLTVYPSQLHGAEIETYNDHRMAMCFAILGLKVLGVKIKNPACVKKTFPNFFQKLAAQPPHGLGVKIFDPIRDPEKKRPLTHEELFAD